MPEQKPISDFYDRLVRSTKIRAALRDQFGGDAVKVFAAMKAGCDLPVELNDAHDTIYDLVLNEARVAKRFAAMGSEAGEYPINVMMLSHVYFVQASQFDEIGFFGTKEEAAQAVMLNWWEAWEK